jgi:hypothetical protein
MGSAIEDWMRWQGFELAGFQRAFLNQMYEGTTPYESESDHFRVRERYAGWSDAWRQALEGAWCTSAWLDELPAGRVYVEGYRPDAANASPDAEPHWDDSLHASLNRTTENPSSGETGWTDLGYTADGGFVYARPAPRFSVGGLFPDPEAVRRSSDELGRVMSDCLEQTRPPIAEMVRALPPVGEILKAYGDRDHPRLAPLVYGNDFRRHRICCTLCNPAGNPKPLTANGADYRRRTRARRRRNRR